MEFYIESKICFCLNAKTEEEARNEALTLLDYMFDSVDANASKEIEFIIKKKLIRRRYNKNRFV